jgi:ubiquinone/menaquinone biosynthesis C-methylase UbiE
VRWNNLEKIDRKSWARDTAIAVHDKNADWFHQQYNTLQDFSDSAFLYGRRQIDLYFKDVIGKLSKPSKILDLGCGTGEQIEELLGMGFEVVGLEPSSNMRNHAVSKLPPGTVVDGSILHIPFPDNYFDCVYAIEVLRYLERNDNLDGLKEIYRVLRPNGIFFGTFVNRYATDGFVIITAIRTLLQRIFKKPPACHVEFTTPNDLRNTFRTIGFKNVEIHGAMFAFLRIIYKLSNKLGKIWALKLDRYDKLFNDHPWSRLFSGHLIGIAQKDSKSEGGLTTPH